MEMGYSWAMAMGFFWRIWESVTCGIGDIQLFLFPQWDGGFGGCGGGKTASSFPNEDHNLSRERHRRREQHISFLQLIFV